jgi:PAS domain S-box-containing protein
MRGWKTARGLNIFDIAQESILAYDLQGRITEWNVAAERLYGWRKADAVGSLVSDLLKSEGDPASNAEKWSGDVIRTTATGRRVVVRTKRHVHWEDEGGPTEIVETGTDVTAQRQAEESLTRAEHRYYNVFQAMAVSFWELDFTDVGAKVRDLMRSGVNDLPEYFATHPEFVREMIRLTRVIDVNDHSVRLFGRGQKKEMLNSLEPYWPEESIPVFAASVVAAVQNIPHYAAETRLSALDGWQLDVWFTACFPPEMLARGKLLIGIVDISSDKKARAELQASEQRYRSLFHFLPVSLLQLDRSETAAYFSRLHAEGIEDLSHYFDTHAGSFAYAIDAIKVVEVNRRTTELFGVNDEQQLLGPVTRLWSEAHKTMRQAMQARFRGASRFEAETKIRTFDGRLVDVLYVAHFPEAFRDDALGLACLIDVSDRVKAQEALAQVQAEFAHAARVSMLGQLTASIAHEVNQPLQAILSNGEAALRWLSKPKIDVAELNALSTRTIADARRASDIIHRIRRMAVHANPEQAPIALNNVIEETVSFLRPELQRHNVEANLELEAGLPTVLADRVQLQQVLVNLAVNAMQAMSSGSVRRLTIRTGRMGTGHVLAEVDDTGGGIPEDYLDRLFGSFFSTKSGGMGIGLTICRSIVEAHGGRIQAVNLPGRAGARFRITLPPNSSDAHTGV